MTPYELAQILEVSSIWMIRVSRRRGMGSMWVGKELQVQTPGPLQTSGGLSHQRTNVRSEVTRSRGKVAGVERIERLEAEVAAMREHVRRMDENISRLLRLTADLAVPDGEESPRSVHSVG